MGIVENSTVRFGSRFCFYGSVLSRFPKRFINDMSWIRNYEWNVWLNLPELESSGKFLYTRAALTTHKLEWLEPWGKLAELELKCSNRELVYVGNTNVTQST